MRPFPLVSSDAFLVCRVQRRYNAARIITQELRPSCGLAESAQNPALFSHAHRAAGESLLWLGDFTPALALANRIAKACWWQAEIHRLKGELLLIADGGLQSAELPPADWLQQALAVARHQHAKSLELRAATSLARLWQSQEKRQEAYALLAPVYESRLPKALTRPT